MTTVCGLDFGTSNSTIGINVADKAQLVTLEQGEPRLRSAIFYNTELKQLIFGEHGVNEYLAGEPGRLMMSLKSLLGSSLLNDKTVIGEGLVPYTDVLGKFIQYLKQKAQAIAQEEIVNVVMGRPVFFHPNPERDRLAQAALDMIARQQGFSQVIFQYEPLAAGFAYESTLTQEQLVLVIDMGGGTSDFSVIKLGSATRGTDRSHDILANYGVRIGGTDLDRRFSLVRVMPLLGMHSMMKGSSSDIHVPNAIYHDLTSWHLLRKLYSNAIMSDVNRIYQLAYEKPLIERLLRILQKQDGHRILNSIELGKKQLSELEQITLDLSFIEAELNLAVTQQEFNNIIATHRADLLAAIDDTMKQAGISNSAIQAIFYTGGTTRIPIIRDDINRAFPQAKVIEGDIFGSVGLGLTLDAMNKFGC